MSLTSYEVRFESKILLLLDVTTLSEKYLLVQNLKYFSSGVEYSIVFASATRALSVLFD